MEFLQNAHDFVFGSEDEKKARELVKRAQTAPPQTRHQHQELLTASKKSRRLFLRQSGLTIAALAAAGIVATPFITSPENRDEQDEEKMQAYLQSFTDLTPLDPEVAVLHNHFMTHRRRGRYENGQMVRLEPGDNNSIYTALIDTKRNPEMYSWVAGFTTSRYREPFGLLMKDMPITPMMAGLKLAYDAKYFHDRITNGPFTVQSAAETMYTAYQMEERVFNVMTGNRYTQRLTELVEQTPDGTPYSLQRDGALYLDELMPPSMSNEELGMRGGAYEINFVTKLVGKRARKSMLNMSDADIRNVEVKFLEDYVRFQGLAE